jgi:RHS repeat-associated protein
VGNRLSSLGVSPYNVNTSNELTSTPSTSYSYDNNGNTLTKVVGSNTTSYSWDFENRLTSVTLPSSGGTVSYRYDPFGRRIYKSSASGTSVYAYDGQDLVEETNASGGVAARYSQTQNIDEPLAMLRAGATSYYDADGLGSVTSLSNGAGSVAQTYGYDSFGRQTNSSGSLTNSFQYTAREFDPETGLYYYLGRYYDPNSGRFLSEDPLGYDGGDTNFYAYVFDSPSNAVDPSGLNGQSWTNPFAGVGRNLNFAWNWFWETDNFGDATHTSFHGKDFLFYGPNTAESQDMMRSAGGIYMQLLYKYKYKCQSSPQNNNFPTWAGYAFILTIWETARLRTQCTIRPDGIRC